MCVQPAMCRMSMDSVLWALAVMGTAPSTSRAVKAMLVLRTSLSRVISMAAWGSCRLLYTLLASCSPTTVL